MFNWPRVDDAAEYSSGDVGCSGRPHPQSGVFCDGVSGERLGRHSPGEEDDDVFLFHLVFVISALFSVCFSFLWYIFMYDFRLPLHRSSAWPKSYWILTTEQSKGFRLWWRKIGSRSVTDSRRTEITRYRLTSQDSHPFFCSFSISFIRFDLENAVDTKNRM